MGMLVPSFAASIINGCALQIFREPMKVGNGPLMALYIFIFTIFLLLWSVKIYPRNLRRLGKAQIIVEFLIAEFLMENLIIDFWFPLEDALLKSLPKLAEQLEEILSSNDWTCDRVCEVLRNETTGYVASYTLSVFLLLCALHATRSIDLRALADGPGCFIQDITHKLKLKKRRLMRKLGFGGKKKVKIADSKRCKSDCCNLKPRKSAETNKSSKTNRRYCPIHNPKCSSDHLDDCSSSISDDFEDIGKLSDYEC